MFTQSCINLMSSSSSKSEPATREIRFITSRAVRLTAISIFVENHAYYAMNAISPDLRQRIIHAVQIDKDTPEQAAERFIVGRASVYRFLEQLRNQGTLQPAQRIIAPRRITADDLPRLREQLEAHNDATLEEHCQLWTEQTSVTLSVSTMHRALKRLSISLKKSRSDP